MSPHLKRLYQIAQAPQRWIVGLMSGTSVDGLDVALCRVSGSGVNTSVEVSEFHTVPYNDEFRDHVRSVFSKKTG